MCHNDEAAGGRAWADAQAKCAKIEATWAPARKVDAEMAILTLPWKVAWTEFSFEDFSLGTADVTTRHARVQVRRDLIGNFTREISKH